MKLRTPFVVAKVPSPGFSQAKQKGRRDQTPIPTHSGSLVYGAPYLERKRRSVSNFRGKNQEQKNSFAFYLGNYCFSSLGFRTRQASPSHSIQHGNNYQLFQGLGGSRSPANLLREYLNRKTSMKNNSLSSPYLFKGLSRSATNNKHRKITFNNKKIRVGVDPSLIERPLLSAEKIISIKKSPLNVKAAQRNNGRQSVSIQPAYMPSSESKSFNTKIKYTGASFHIAPSSIHISIKLPSQMY